MLMHQSKLIIVCLLYGWHEELAPAHQYNQCTSGETVHVFADEIGGIDDHGHILVEVLSRNHARRHQP